MCNLMVLVLFLYDNFSSKHVMQALAAMVAIFASLGN